MRVRLQPDLTIQGTRVATPFDSNEAVRDLETTGHEYDGWNTPALARTGTWSRPPRSTRPQTASPSAK